MWFLEQLMPDSAVYNIPAALRLRGGFDVAAMRRALVGLVDRHESLRTRLVTDGDGVPRAVIDPPGGALVDVVDLSVGVVDGGSSGVDRALELLAVMSHERVDLGLGPVFRAVVARVGVDDHVVLMVVHHVAADQWSLGVMGRELSSLYATEVAGVASVLPDLPFQYVDFAASQRAWMQGDEFERQLGYWREQLRDLTPVELPLDRPRPPMETYVGETLRWPIPAGLLADVERFAQREGVTFFAVMLASFELLLARYGDRDDVSVGVPFSNRRDVGTESVVGNFVNTIVLRGDLSGSPSFVEFVHRVQGALLDAAANQDVPFEALVADLAVHRDMSRAPLVQVLFNIHQPPSQIAELAGLDVEPLFIDRHVAQFELSVLVLTGEAVVEPQVVVEFNADVFVVGSVERLVGAWGVLLAAGVGDGSLGVGVLPLVAGGDRELLLSGGGLGGVVVPGWLRVDEWFASVVGSCGGAVAVSCGGEVLSYEGLDVLSNRLARVLVGLGVGPGSCVGVAVERSVGMVVALLGVLKAGAAYVPLDPGFPGERLAFMVADSGVGVVVTSGVVAAGVFDGSLFDVSGLRFVDLDRDAGVIGGMDGSSLGVVGGEVAYVIYTSGSTGVPKGVVVGHRGVIKFLASMQVEPGLSVGDVLVAVTTLSFDISVLEVFLPLVSGASVVVAPGEVVGDGRLLAGLIESSGASVVQATPTTWSMLLESGWVGSPGLKVLCGGEAMSRGLADRLVGCCGSVWNMFGPTETTIWSTVFEVSPGGVGLVPIGRPIANTVCRVLDSAGELVPVGVPGELFIGGAGVALGYLGRDELTAERFVPDRFGSGGRLYRTGDLVRWRGDRCLEFLGRLDHQVKVRGYRIELGEVESVLRACPGVVEAVVVADGVAASARLVAYLTVLDGAGGVDVGMLREWVGSRLPGYMVPSVFITLDHFPMTPNRKIDRNALPAPDGSRAATIEFVAPRDDVESTIARTMAEVLHVERVGAYDDFFELGGHSLLASSLLVRLSDTFRTTLRLRDFFQGPNVAGIADRLCADPAERDRVHRIARVQARLAALTAEQVAELLAAKRAERAGSA